MEPNNQSRVRSIDDVLKRLSRPSAGVTSTDLDEVLRCVLKELGGEGMLKVGQDHNEYQRLRQLQKKAFGRETEHDSRVRELYSNHLLFEKLEQLRSSIKTVKNREDKTKKANTESHDIRWFGTTNTSTRRFHSQSSNRVWNPYTKKYIDRDPILQNRSNMPPNPYKRSDKNSGIRGSMHSRSSSSKGSGLGRSV
jgi:hypothetical protein